jgi:hypothetical protein
LIEWNCNRVKVRRYERAEQCFGKTRPSNISPFI